MSFINQPQQVWWRKALFQIHLWVGIFVALYAIVIGITGSILVFKDELAAWSYPQFAQPLHPGEPEQADLVQIMERAEKAHPGFEAQGIYPPGVGSGNMLVYMEGKDDRGLYAFADSVDGHLLGAIDLKSTWLNWIAELHFNLLMGLPGYVVNVVFAALLLILCLTGIVLWWPGIRRWTEALYVDFRRGWKRINFDLHSAGGIYTLAFIAMWSLSGINFIFPKQVAAAVSVFSPVADGVEPEFKITTKTRGANLNDIVAQARIASPGTAFAGLYAGEDASQPIRVFMARAGRDDFSRMNYVFFDPSNGKLLGVWRGGETSTLGGAFVYWLSPLHFGIAWGLGIKILWAVLGLSLPMLAVTGCWMYWNRYLGRRWKQFRSAAPASHEELLTTGKVSS